MGLDVKQFREFIVRPTLEKLQLHSMSAENLLVGTAMIESRLEHLKQLNNGPAVSVYQIEPITYKDLRRRIIKDYRRISEMGLALLNMEFFPDDASYLIGNLVAATMFARFKYLFDKEPLPPATDAKAMALYWKRIYNTPLGKGSIDIAEKIFHSVIHGYTYHS